jgi:hypothetical protein
MDLKQQSDLTEQIDRIIGLLTSILIVLGAILGFLFLRM